MCPGKVLGSAVGLISELSSMHPIGCEFNSYSRACCHKGWRVAHSCISDVFDKFSTIFKASKADGHDLTYMSQLLPEYFSISTVGRNPMSAVHTIFRPNSQCPYHCTVHWHSTRVHVLSSKSKGRSMHSGSAVLTGAYYGTHYGRK